MTTPPIDLPALTEIAKAATPGPWVVMDAHDPGEGVNFIDVHQDGASWAVVSRREPERHDDRGAMERDAAHIAAFDPPTVLALLNRVEEAERMAGEWEKAARYNAESADAFLTQRQASDARAVAAEKKVAAGEVALAKYGEYAHECPGDCYQCILDDARTALGGTP